MPITSRLVRDGLEEIFHDIRCRAIRPGLGLAPKYLEEAVGKTVKQDVNRGTALKWGM